MTENNNDIEKKSKFLDAVEQVSNESNEKYAREFYEIFVWTSENNVKMFTDSFGDLCLELNDYNVKEVALFSYVGIFECASKMIGKEFGAKCSISATIQTRTKETLVFSTLTFKLTELKH